MHTSSSIAGSGLEQLNPAQRAKVQKAARDFEAVFVRQIIASMRKAGQALGDDSQDESEKMSMDMAWDGLADKVAATGGFGLAKVIEPWLAKDLDSLGSIRERMGVESASGASANAVKAYAGQASRPNATLEELVKRASAATGVDSSLIRGVIQAESAGNDKARSPKGAVGLMQLMPSTAAELGVDPHDPAQNVLGGARYLASLLKKFDGNETLALAGYNAGPGAVDRYGGVPPYAETRNYVTTVLAHRRRFAGGER